MPNVKVIITMPATVLPRIQAAKVAKYAYKAEILDPETGDLIPNPVTVQEFLLATRIQEEKDNLKKYEVPRLAIEDRAARIEEIDGIEITITTEIVP